MFIDTSALLAILLGEASASALEQAIDIAPTALTSALVVLEAAMVMSTRMCIEPAEAEAKIREFLDRTRIGIVPIDDVTVGLAVDAFARFGKGRGHSARLNLADCLSYAAARQHRLPLLYVGEDFAATDIAASRA